MHRWTVPRDNTSILPRARAKEESRAVFAAPIIPRRRGDGTFEPNFQGIIETTDGAVIFHDCHGYGRTYPVDRRKIVVSATHLSDDPRYKWLNDSVAVGEGEVRTLSSSKVELVIDWFETMWEPIAD